MEKNSKVKGHGKKRVNDAHGLFTETLFIYLTPAHKEWIHEIAFKNRVSYSRLIHDLIQSVRKK